MLDWIPASGSAEARRFPNWASRVYRMARERGPEAVARVLDEVAHLGTSLASASEDLEATTIFYLDLVVMPLLLRALFGERLTSFRTEIGAQVASANG